MPRSTPLPRWSWLAFILLAIGTLGLAAAPVVAQEQFMTQSGGRGLQNAKTNARLSKNEKDVGDLQTELAKVKQHAKEDILQCIDTGAKLRWDGTRWTCDQETDPTVQRWAKEALPACAPGTLLSVVGGSFTCNSSGFVSAETDPTVQNFAKSPLPLCGTGDVLSVGADGGLSCKADEKGITGETDPMVHDFARTDKGLVQNCSTGEVSKMVGSRLTCVVDEKGITAETDPMVQDFARNDIPSYSVAACATGQILTSVSSGGKIILQCTGAAGALTNVLGLNDLTDVDLTASTADEVLRFNGTKWVNSNDKIGSLVSGGTCLSNGTEIVCNGDAPMACGAGEFLQWDGANWVCTSAATALAPTIRLDDLGDVTLTTPVSGHVLTWNGTGWVNQEKYNITLGDSEVRVVDSVPGGTGLVQLIPDGVAILTATQGKVGIRTNSPTYDLDVNGTGRVTNNMIVGGNLTVGGSVSFTGSLNVAGVTFANGGIQVSGTLSGDRISATDASVTTLTARDVSITRNQTVDGNVTINGNLRVSGTQTFEGVTFANGGIQASGTVASNNIEADEGTIVSLTAQDVSVTRNMTVAGGLSAAGIGVTNLNAGTVTATTLGTTGDLRVGGNLFVSGSQTFDGVTFANGGIQVSGTLSSNRIAANEGTIVSLTSQDVSVTRNLTVAGHAALGSATITNNLTVLGNLNVSGMQTLGGVLFANGGVSATGSVTATSFAGDGTRLTGVVAASTDRVVSGTTSLIATQDGSITINVAGSNTLTLGNTGAALNINNGRDMRFGSGGKIIWSGYGSVGYNTGKLEMLAGSLPLVLGSNNVERMRIAQTTGYVGINTTNPNADLDVMGRVSATNVSVSGIITAGSGQFTTLGASTAGLGQVAMTSATVTGDLRVGGNFYVSGSQTIEGVTFANGGVSATGGVTATYFTGDGYNITNLNTSAVTLGINDLTDAIASNTISSVFLGLGAGNYATGINNTALGYGALASTTTGWRNVAIGRGALGQITTNSGGINSVAVGNFAAAEATTARNSVAIGGEASRYTKDLSNSVVIGFQTATASAATRNWQSVIVGYQAGNALLDSTNNILLGYQAGRNLTTGSNNIFIGTGAGTNAPVATNYALNIGNTIYGDMTNAVAGVGGAAKVGINWVTPTVPLEVSGTISATNLRLSGNLYVSGSQVIDGVMFANGGISATGAVTATYFTGDGSRITNLSAQNVVVSDGVSGSLVYRDNNGGLRARSSLFTSGTQIGMGILPSWMNGSSSYDHAFYTTGNIYSERSFNVQASGEAGLAWGSGGVSVLGDNSTSQKYMRFVTSSTEAMRIVSTGMVGIGTSAPSATLHLAGTQASLRIAASTAGRYLSVSSTTQGEISQNIGGIRFFTANQFFHLGDQEHTYFMPGSYNVGIGTGVPNAKFEVRGDISATDLRLSGNLYVSGSQVFGGVMFANGGVSATGGVTATYFTGDGSRLTNINTSSFDDDQIVSGTTSVVANTNGYISFTTGGVNTGYLDTTGRLVVPGISTTASSPNSAIYDVLTVRQQTNSNASGLHLYSPNSSTGRFYMNSTNIVVARGSTPSILIPNSGDRVGINPLSSSFTPSSTLHIVGVSDSTGGLTLSTALGRHAELYPYGSASVMLNLPSAGSFIITGNGVAAAAFDTSNKRLMVGTSAAPSTTLHVSGTILTTSWTGINFAGLRVTPTAPLEVSGTVSATAFVGDGSGLTNLNSGGITAAGSVGSIQFKGASNEISGTNDITWSHTNKNLNVSGTVQVAGTGSEACAGVSDYGKSRFIDTGGGVYKMQMCRP